MKEVRNSVSFSSMRGRYQNWISISRNWKWNFKK